MGIFYNLIIDLYPSRWLFTSSVTGHLLAGAAVVISAAPLWIKAGWIAAILFSLIHLRWQYRDQRRCPWINRIELLDRRWRLETGDGVIHHAQMTSGYAHPGIVILNFRLDTGQRRSLTLLPDAADAESLRRLRVWLRTRLAIEEPD